MHSGQRVSCEQGAGVLVSFQLGMVGALDEGGFGTLKPAMVGTVRLDDGSEVSDIPLSELREEFQPNARSV